MGRKNSRLLRVHKSFDESIRKFAKENSLEIVKATELWDSEMKRIMKGKRIRRDIIF